jgi:hypothetical protein
MSATNAIKSENGFLSACPRPRTSRVRRGHFSADMQYS